MSGAAAVAVPMLFMAIASGRSPFLLTPVVLLATAVGAGSAYAMAALARRSAPVDLNSLDAHVAGAGEVLAANAEVERLLVERDDLTMVGAAGRAKEATAGPPPEEDGLI